MVEIDVKTAVEFLKQDLLRHVCIPLNEDFENGVSPLKIMGNKDIPSAIVIAPQSDGDYNFVCMAGYDVAFTGDALAWLTQTFSKFRLCSHDERVFKHPQILELLELTGMGKSVSYACDSLDRVPSIVDPRVRKLTEANMQMAARYPRIRPEGDPGPNLPDMIKTHEVYGISEAEEIIGFIAVYQDYHDIWDVDIVHVREEHRCKGICTTLAAAYARAMLMSDRIPYYSGTNEFSGKAAQNAGYFVCRELYWSDARSKSSLA